MLTAWVPMPNFTRRRGLRLTRHPICTLSTNPSMLCRFAKLLWPPHRCALPARLVTSAALSAPCARWDTFAPPVPSRHRFAQSHFFAPRDRRCQPCALPARIAMLLGSRLLYHVRPPFIAPWACRRPCLAPGPRSRNRVLPAAPVVLSQRGAIAQRVE